MLSLSEVTREARYHQPKATMFTEDTHIRTYPGKTTLASKVVHALNSNHRESSPGAAAGSSTPLAAFVPMDGYHLTRAQLSAMPDPDTAHARRGASFTFDGSAFIKLIKALREPITPEAKTLYAPSFDHAVKDPVENDIPIAPGAKIVVFEGNYVALDEKPWDEARELMDEIWFVEVEESVARRRLIKRHVDAGIAKDEEEAGQRADQNDLVNGRQIVQHRVRVDELVKSVDDETWKPERQGGHER